MKIIQELQRVQQEQGYLSDDRLHEVANRLAVPLYQVENVARFFPHFRSEMPPKVDLHICNTMTCALRGSRKMLAWAQAECDRQIGLQSEGQKQLAISGVPCLGQCDQAPAALLYVNDQSHTDGHEPQLYSRLDEKEIQNLIESCANNSVPEQIRREIIVNSNEDQWQIDPYRDHPIEKRYKAVTQFFEDLEKRRKELEAVPEERDRLQKEVVSHRDAIDEERNKIKSLEAALQNASTLEKSRLREAILLRRENLIAKEATHKDGRRKLSKVNCRLRHAEMVRDALRNAGNRKPSLQEIATVLTRRAVFVALRAAGLLGMGGAGARAYKKWNDVRLAQGEQKYVVCNADESEPGTFKDRELLLRFPHLLVEAMVLAGLVVGAENGYIYVRHEFEPQIKALQEEISVASGRRICGSNILGHGDVFELEVVTSPGGYICGEQTALIEVLEDKRSEPRNRPPELQTNGLWDMPTLLHNVETLSWVPAILLKQLNRNTSEPVFTDWKMAGRSFSEQGVSPFRGRRFFSISGDVKRPGVYEVSIGSTLGELILHHAGGILEDREIKALALSGPSGGFLPRYLRRAALGKRFVSSLSSTSDTFDLLEMPLDIQTARNMNSREVNLMLGAGIVIYADGADMVSQAVVCSEFYRDESCGKCVPCRLGSKQMADWAAILQERRFDRQQCQVVHDQVVQVGEVMQLSSICGLGMVAAAPLRSLLEFFPKDVENHLS
ncbi:MAG: NAD(P)H-dependent oxidoreductase subunit E [Pirellulales bacterium]